LKGDEESDVVFSVEPMAPDIVPEEQREHLEELRQQIDDLKAEVAEALAAKNAMEQRAITAETQCGLLAAQLDAANARALSLQNAGAANIRWHRAAAQRLVRQKGAAISHDHVKANKIVEMKNLRQELAQRETTISIIVAAMARQQHKAPEAMLHDFDITELTKDWYQDKDNSGMTGAGGLTQRKRHESAAQFKREAGGHLPEVAVPAPAPKRYIIVDDMTAEDGAMALEEGDGVIDLNNHPHPDAKQKEDIELPEEGLGDDL
jgi:hypothetical protein